MPSKRLIVLASSFYTAERQAQTFYQRRQQVGDVDGRLTLLPRLCSLTKLGASPCHKEENKKAADHQALVIKEKVQPLFYCCGSNHENKKEWSQIFSHVPEVTKMDKTTCTRLTCNLQGPCWSLYVMAKGCSNPSAHVQKATHYLEAFDHLHAESKSISRG